ncbi:MAG: hypothetical protein ACREV6_01560 [Clostridium sp.]|uniref:hypothetical protein n=1 Tax=Clostridium sp. TaxID=1506 RepID=UPI003D6D7936
MKGLLAELPSVSDKYQELQWEILSQALKEIDQFVIQRWSVFLIALCRLNGVKFALEI